MPNLIRLLIWVLLILLPACAGFGAPMTPTPTRDFSAPTIAPSPTVRFQTSDQLYDDNPDAGINDPTAAAAPSRGILPPLELGTPSADGGVPIQIALPNDVVLSGTMYQQGEARVPGVVLFASDVTVWGDLPQMLVDGGMTALVMPPLPRADQMTVVMESFIEVGTVDPARLAAVGIAESADLVMMACALDEICDAAVLLNPQSRDTLANLMPNYGERPLLIAASTEDATAYAVALALSSRGDHVERLDYEQGVGTQLLMRNTGLQQGIVRWLVGVFGG